MAYEEHITIAFERLADVFRKRPATAFDPVDNRGSKPCMKSTADRVKPRAKGADKWVG
jgi:hypothetical protein